MPLDFSKHKFNDGEKVRLRSVSQLLDIQNKTQFHVAEGMRRLAGKIVVVSHGPVDTYTTYGRTHNVYRCEGWWFFEEHFESLDCNEIVFNKLKEKI